MTATWKMEATTADDTQVLLTFYSGPSARPPSYVNLSGTVVGKSREKRQFNSQHEADEWAFDLEVRRWRVTEHVRAFPEASQIPIEFAEAPDAQCLQDLISKFEAGTPLTELVGGVMVRTTEREFQVTPALLRKWLIGADPTHPALQRLKRR